MKKTDIAYTAGIIDGEGCITLSKYYYSITNRRKQRTSLSVKVSMTDEWMVRWLQFSWGGAVSCHQYTDKPNWSDYWSWQIQANQATKFLKVLLPYLHLKRQQAELAIKFQARKRGKGQRATDEELVLQEADYILMRTLKKRGKSHQGEVYH